MFRKKQRKPRKSNYSIIIGLAVVILIGYIFTYFTNNKKYIEIPFNTLLKNTHHYSKSSKKGWHKINCGPFEVETPKDYLFYKLEGIDSYIGGFTNKIDSLEFDYGLYSNSLNQYHSDNYLVQNVKINSKDFKVVIEKGNNFIGAFTEDLYKDKRFVIFTINNVNHNQNLMIINSIKFN